MLPEIQTINPTLNVMESTYGVIFNRNIVAKEDNGQCTVLHLLVDTWITPEVSPGRHIFSCIILIDNVSNTVYGGVILFIKGNDNYYNNYEIINKLNENIASGALVMDGPIVKPPVPEALFLEPSIHVTSVVRNGNEITVYYSVDITFNFISFDLWTDSVTYGRNEIWV